MTDTPKPLNPSFITWAKGRMKEMKESAADATEALGLPPEKKYGVLKAMYGQRALSEASAKEGVPWIGQRIAQTLAGAIKDAAQGVVQLAPMPVHMAFGSPMLGFGGPPVGAGTGSFSLPLVLLPSETGKQRARVVGHITLDADGAAVDVQLFRHRVQGDLPLEGYGIVLVDPRTEDLLRVGSTDANGRASFGGLPPEAVQQYVRLLVLSPELLSRMRLLDEWSM